MYQPLELILGFILLLAAVGVIAARKPVYSGLSFLVVLLTLSVFYIQLSAEFIGLMQILVYAGAILVIFMFVIILFQDAYLKIEAEKPLSWKPLLFSAAVLFLAAGGIVGSQLNPLPLSSTLPEGYGTVQSLGKDLFLDFFFPFEIIVVMFLVALVGAVYIGKKVR